MGPIKQLMDDLLYRGKPSIKWLVRWSVNGIDPVLSAWNHEFDKITMREFLAFVEHPITCHGAPWPEVECREECHDFFCKACCNTIRQNVPVLPTLVELLAMPYFQQKRASV